MNLAADISLTAVAAPTRNAAAATQKANPALEDIDHSKAANDGGSFSDCLKASGDAAAAADDAEQADVKADAAQPDKTADDQDSDSTAEPQGLGLVAVLLQTILAMPPKNDRGAPADVAVSTPGDSVAGIGDDAAKSVQPAEPSLAALKNQPVGNAVDTQAPTFATQTDVTALPAAHDTVPDALLALLNAPAAAVAGTDRAAAVAAPMPSAPSQPMPHGELAEPLAERIVWMSDTARAHGAGSVQEARISLHPAELGSLQIKVELSHDGSTKVSFDVQTEQARQAIEASLPQLRELLAPNLVNAATASFQLSGGLSQQQQQASSQPRSARSVWSADGDAAEVQSVTPVTARRRIGLLDQFA